MATKEGLSRGIACLIILGLLGIGWAKEKPTQGTDKGKEQKMTQIQRTQTITQKEIRNLIQDLDSEDNRVKARAIEALGELKVKEAVPKIIKNLQDEDCPLRTLAYGALVKIGDKRVVPYFIRDLDSEDSWVRTYAIGELGELKVKEAVPKIIKSLQDADRSVRAQACFALGKIKDKRAVPYLIERLKNEEENWIVRLGAATSLAQIGSPEAFEPLLEILKYECDIDRKNLNPPIPKSYGSDDEVLERRYVIVIVDLCSINKKECVPTLIKHLKEKKQHSKYRFYIAKVLGRLGEKEVVPVLIEYLEKSKSGLIREDAANILGSLGDKRAIEPLKKVLNDNYICKSTGDVKKNYGYVVRLAAYRSLLKLGVKVEKKGDEYRVIE